MSAGSVTQPPSVLARVGEFFFAWRNWVFTATLLGLLFGIRPALFLGSQSADYWLDLAGILVALAGQGIRLVVIGFTPIQSGGSRKRIDAKRLITEGALSHCRNPLYVGNILVVVGFALVHNHPLLYLVGISLTLFGYSAIVASEEAFLTGRFGDEYREYCRRVSRWIPKLQGLKATFSGMRFEGKRALFQEYGSIYLAVAIPLALVIYEQVASGYPANHPGVLTAGALLAVLTVAWAAVRRMKLADIARRNSETVRQYWS